MTTPMTPSWAPTDHEEYDALKGRDLVSADGEELGTVEAVFHPRHALPAVRGGHYFLVKPSGIKSWFGLGEECYVPESAIATVTDDAVTLAVPKDQIESQGWNAAPAELDRFNRA
jgi:hypothetical protein